MTGSYSLRRTVPALSLLALATLGLAACGGGSSLYGGGAPAAAPTGPTSAEGIHVASTTDGSVLVDASGRTLYMLTADSTGRSSCDGACVAAWPVAGPTTHSSAVSAKLGSLARSDGSQQLTVNGMPAYTYVADRAAGDVNGQGVVSFGGTWWVLSPSGMPITMSMSAPAGGRY